MHCVGQSDSCHCTFLVDYSVILWLYFYCCLAIIAIKGEIGILEPCLIVRNLCAEIWCLTSLHGSVTQIFLTSWIIFTVISSSVPVGTCLYQHGVGAIFSLTVRQQHYIISPIVWEHSFIVTARFRSSEICKHCLFFQLLNNNPVPSLSW